MKLLNDELNDNILNDVDDEVLDHLPYYSPVRNQIRKNFGWWGNNNLIRLKIGNPKWHMRNDIDETT